jgi:hypothetical protein
VPGQDERGVGTLKDAARRRARRLTSGLLSLVVFVGGCGPASPTAVPSPSALPAALADKTWVTSNPVDTLGAYVAGTLDGRYHLILPRDEAALTAAQFRVVSAIWTAGQNGSIEQSTLIVRDLRQDGAEIARFTASGSVGPGQAAVTTDALFFVGNGGPDVVAGIYAGSLADGSVRTLVAPGPVPADLGALIGPVAPALSIGPGVSRGAVALSPSGQTLGSAVCGPSRCHIELLHLPDGTLLRRLIGVGSRLWLLSDTILITVESGRLGALDLAGQRRWVVDDALVYQGYLTADGQRLVVLYENVQTVTTRLTVIDLASGAETVVMEWGRAAAAPWLWAAVSTDEFAVLIPNGVEPGEALEQGGGSFRADLLDLRTGTLAAGALSVSAR